MEIMCSHVNVFYGGVKDFEVNVVRRLKETGSGCKEKASFKYIGVGIRQEKRKVVMSQRHYSRSIREVEKWKFGREKVV